MGLKRLKLYLDPDGRLGPQVGARGYPTTLIVGPDGAPLAFARARRTGTATP